MTVAQQTTTRATAQERSLLQLLEDKGIFAEMMEKERRETFVSEYYGSCGVDLGYTSYDERQIRTLLAAVPEFFPYYWRWDKNTELTEIQLKVLMEVNNGGNIHPSKRMNLFHIHRIISKARIYAGV